MTKDYSQELENLDLSKDVLSKIASNTSNAVIVADLKGRIVYVNEGFERITEYTAKEVLGLRPGKLLQGPDTDRETVKRIGEKLRAFERVNETILNYAKSGRSYWLQLDIYPLFDADGAPECFMAIESDVTQLKESERLAREQNERIQENISYAQLLQNALFRDPNELNNLFDDFFIIDRPRDKVGGDFYLVDNIQGKKVALLGDCTGHGVSGAIMTAMSISIIKEQLAMFKTLDAELILEKSLQKLGKMLSGGRDDMADTFEATLLFIDERKQSVRYASTSQSLYLFGEKVEQLIKKKRGSTKSSNIGMTGIFDYEPGTMVYLSSDGFQDQFGGPDCRKFGSTAMMDMFGAVHAEACDEQKKEIEKRLDAWQQDEDQTDDILVLGIKLT